MVTKVTEQIYQQISELGNKKIWSGIIYNVKEFGAKGDYDPSTGTGTDDTAAIANAINSANGRPIAFPPGVYAATQIAFPDNVHVIFFNAKFFRIEGTGPFITTGQNSILFGNVEIDGNKTNIPGAKGDIGIILQTGTKCFARVNSHDNHGHGIVLESNTDIYSPVAHGNGMTYDPNGMGEGDGIYTVNSENVNIINPYAYNNSRMGITVTTSPTNPDACKKVKIINPHVPDDNAYFGVDVEYASECIVQNLTGWCKMASSNSKDCIYENLQVKMFYGNNTERITVKKVKCKPLGDVFNVFFLSGLDPVVEDLYVFNTATTYTSNTVEIRDTVNLRAIVKNVVIEKGHNGFTGAGIFELRNVTVKSANNRSYLIDGRNVRGGRMLEIINGFLRASNNVKPNTGQGYTGTYKVGDIVWNDAPTELGNAGSKYVVQGWLCTVAGDPATWLEMRTLTGN